MKGTLLCLLVTSLLACSASAQTLMLDFGPTAVTGGDATNSPLNSATGFAQTTWNTSLTGADIPSGLLYSDGSSATGVTVNIGQAVDLSQSTVMDLSNTSIKNSALGGTINTGVYSGTSVGKDAVFSNFDASKVRAVGFQLGGLSAGSYDIYVSGRNTSSVQTYSETVAIGTSASAGNFDFSGYANSSMSFSGSSDVSAWAEGGNYVKMSVTLAASEYINLAIYGGGADGRGFLNSVQIYSAVPEPSTYALIAGGFVLLLLAYRRRSNG